jgi:ankyrin repeat protein
MTAHSSVNEVPIDELWKCFSSAVSGIEKVYCVVDALDEMETGHDSFLVDLLNLGRRNPKSVKLALTSRQLPHLEAHLKGSCLVDLRLDRKNVDRDIATYISYRLKHCRIDLSEDQLRGIGEAICDKGKGLFLYARLMMDQCLQDPADFVSQLDKLPDGLGNMYTDLLQEHVARSETTEDFQRLVLEWITHSTRPLRLLELTTAINSLPDGGGLRPDQDTKNSIRTCCGPLLELCENQVIQIIHHSFTEFLVNPNQHHVQMTADAVRFPILNPTLAHRAITVTCVKYLQSGCFDQWEHMQRSHATGGRDDNPKAQKQYHEGESRTTAHKNLVLGFPFLDYAVQNWPFHAEKLSTPDTELLEQLDALMQNGSHNFESWKEFWDGLNTALPDNFSPLHVAAHCELASYAQRLLIQGVDLNATDSYQRAPITYATIEGRDRTLEVLLDEGARFDDPDIQGWVAIHLAARRKQPGALRLLLNAGAAPLAGKIVDDPYYNADSRKSTIGQTALFYACQYGHVEALNELLKHLAPSQLLDGPLHWAADLGRSEILTVLLQYEQVRAYINAKDENGNTPLYLAGRKQDPATVRVLLEHKADVHARSEDKGKRTKRPGDVKPIEPRLKMSHKPNLGYTAIHGLVHFNSHDILYDKLGNIKEILELLIDVCGYSLSWSPQSSSPYQLV